MMVMTRKPIWIRPSCKAMGIPMRKICPVTIHLGRKQAFVTGRPVPLRQMTMSAMTTLMAWASVVPSAAPAGPKCRAPMKRKSRAMLATQAMAMKYMGLFESPMPRKMALMIL